MEENGPKRRHVYSSFAQMVVEGYIKCMKYCLDNNIFNWEIYISLDEDILECRLYPYDIGMGVNGVIYQIDADKDTPEVHARIRARINECCQICSDMMMHHKLKSRDKSE